MRGSIVIIGEALKVYELVPPEQIDARVTELMGLVGLQPNYARRYLREFSRWQRQRIRIARAFVVEPKFIVAYETVSALDVFIQTQVINLSQDL